MKCGKMFDPEGIDTTLDYCNNCFYEQERFQIDWEAKNGDPDLKRKRMKAIIEEQRMMDEEIRLELRGFPRWNRD